MQFKEREVLYKKFAIVFGNDIQLVKAIEELSELIKAISKYQIAKIMNNTEIDLFNIKEEIVDSFIMIEQLVSLFDFNLDEIEENIEEKLIRTNVIAELEKEHKLIIKNQMNVRYGKMRGKIEK